jgi:hypothetical protein
MFNQLLAMTNKACQNHWCQNQFEVTNSDRDFYKKMSPECNGQLHLIPEPTRCPSCRQQRRLAWRNERTLYKRKCDYSGKDIVTTYSPESPYKVYSNDVWYSDKWDPRDYGRDYNFTKPFFQQFKELQIAVPRLALVAFDVENSPYVNQCWHIKNCHLCFDVGYCEDMLYCYCTYHSTNCIDVIYAEKNELCFSTINSKNCYNSVYLQDCKDCSDSYFSFACKNSKYILFCENLVGKEYYIRNKKVTPEQFGSSLENLNLSSHKNWKSAVQEFQQRKSDAIKRANRNINVENCTGEDMYNSRNCHNTYECFDAEDTNYVTRGDHKIKDCQDCDHLAEIELGYEGVSWSGYKNAFGFMSYQNEECYYCDLIMNSHHLFGCTNMHKQQYCILNKQYLEEEYNQLVPKIIEHMKSTGEWGEMFHQSISPFGYNETLGMNYYPMTKEEAQSKGFNWSTYESTPPEVEKSIPAIKLPDTTAQVPDDILNWAIICESTGKPFQLMPKELNFYRKQNLPIPRIHPDERFKDLMKQRNPRKLRLTNCSHCRKEMETSYPLDEKGDILCIECYQQAVY